MREEELLRPAPDPLQHPHRQPVPAAQERCHLPGPHRVLRPQPRHVPTLRATPLVSDPERHDPQPLIGLVHRGQLREHASVHEQPVVVQVNDDIHVPACPQMLDGHVPAPGHPEVLLQLDSVHAHGQLRQRAAVAHHHDPRGRQRLPSHRLQQRLQLDGPVAHGQDSDPQAWTTHR